MAKGVTVWFSYALSMISFDCPNCGENNEIITEGEDPSDIYSCLNCGKEITLESGQGGLPDAVKGESADYETVEDGSEEDE